MCKPNKHLHEKLTQPPHLSAAPGRQPCQGASNFLPNQRQFANFKIKERRERGAVWSMIYSLSQGNSSPLKWYFSWVLTLQSSSSLGIYVSLLHVFFSGFYYCMTHGSPQSAVCNLSRVALAQSIFLFPNSELMLCLSWRGDQLHSASKAFSQRRKRPGAVQPEYWHLQLAMYSV